MFVLTHFHNLMAIDSSVFNLTMVAKPSIRISNAFQKLPGERSSLFYLYNIYIYLHRSIHRAMRIYTFVLYLGGRCKTGVTESQTPSASV